MRYVPQKLDGVIEIKLTHQQFETRALGAVAGNEAEKIEASIFELPARVQEELVILYRVQPSDSEHYKRLFLAPLWTYCTYGRSIDPEAVHDNFVGTYIRVILKDVAPVIFRDGQAKLAIAELLVEI